MKVIKNTKGRGVYCLTRHYEIVHMYSWALSVTKYSEINMHWISIINTRSKLSDIIWILLLPHLLLSNSVEI